MRMCIPSSKLFLFKDDFWKMREITPFLRSCHLKILLHETLGKIAYFSGLNIPIPQ